MIWFEFWHVSSSTSTSKTLVLFDFEFDFEPQIKFVLFVDYSSHKSGKMNSIHISSRH